MHFWQVEKILNKKKCIISTHAYCTTYECIYKNHLLRPLGRLTPLANEIFGRMWVGGRIKVGYKLKNPVLDREGCGRGSIR